MAWRVRTSSTRLARSMYANIVSAFASTTSLDQTRENLNLVLPLAWRAVQSVSSVAAPMAAAASDAADVFSTRQSFWGKGQ